MMESRRRMKVMPDLSNPWSIYWLAVYTGLLGGIGFWLGTAMHGGKYAFVAGAVVACWMLLFCIFCDSDRRPDGSGRWLSVQHIGHEDGSQYLRRVHLLPLNPHMNLYLHIFVGSDDGRGMHDHPWESLSLCILGRMTELVPGNRANTEHGMVPRGLTCAIAIGPGSIRFRRAGHVHRLELRSTRAVTLFLTGPRRRTWGFWIDGSWVPSAEFYRRRQP